MPVAVFLIALGLMVQIDPMGYYHDKSYTPPTPVEHLRNEWFAAQFAADMTEDNKVHDAFLAQQRNEIMRKAVTHGINPNEVFNG